MPGASFFAMVQVPSACFVIESVVVDQPLNSPASATEVAPPAKVNTTPSAVGAGGLPLPAGAATGAAGAGAAVPAAPPTTITEFLPP